MTTITQTLTAPGAAPSRSQAPATFIANMDARLAWENTNVAETTTLIGQINTVAGEVNTNAGIAATQAGISAAQVGLATAQVELATAQVGLATTQANNASASALTAVSAPGTSATSTTSDTIALGTTTIVIQTGKSLVVGMWVISADTGAPGINYMVGPITDYNSDTGSLTFTAVAAEGSGTKTAWTVSLTVPIVSRNTSANSALYFFGQL